MNPIHFLYAENTISRRNRTVIQRLVFQVSVQNLGYEKSVDIFWSNEQGDWSTLTAHYVGVHGNDREYWRAEAEFVLDASQGLPGNVAFSCCLRSEGQEYWDNRGGANYAIQADSGVLLNEQSLQNVTAHGFDADSSLIPVRVAVATRYQAKTVRIKWTVDDWKTVQFSDCQLSHRYWDQFLSSNARNPNQHGVQLWEAKIETGCAFSLQYSICAENDHETLWDNNAGYNYALEREHLKVLILNLHCYQEDDQMNKFKQIALAIAEQKVDIVCLQEVAEYWNDGHGDWNSNAARIINDFLPQPFHLHTDWSHLGFDRYREGVAILSRYPMSHHQARYVSDSHDIYDIHSRKVVTATVHVPYVGAINVYSVHLSWIENGFKEQFETLHHWAVDNHQAHTQATLLCGDFNITAGSEGYQQIVHSKQYDDQFLLANKQGLFESIFRVDDPHWRELLTEDYRIDYIFMNSGGGLQVTSARVLFTDDDYGRVSDHCGYLMTFEPKSDQAETKEGSYAIC